MQVQREKKKTTFCSKSGKKTEARRLNLIKFVHLWWLPRVNPRDVHAKIKEKNGFLVSKYSHPKN